MEEVGEFRRPPSCLSQYLHLVLEDEVKWLTIEYIGSGSAHGIGSLRTSMVVVSAIEEVVRMGMGLLSCVMVGADTTWCRV